MPSTRYTVRLPPALDAAVQERILTTQTPFAELMRAALSAYLADTSPTGQPTPADTLMELQSHLVALTVRVEILEQSAPPTPADSADILSTLQAQVEELTTQVKVIEEILTQWPQLVTSTADRTPTDADRPADTVPTGADTPAPPRRPGRPSSPLRQRALALLQDHPEGLSAEQLRVYLQAQRPIGDLLQGMQRAGLIQGRGRGPARRYVTTAPTPA